MKKPLSLNSLVVSILIGLVVSIAAVYADWTPPPSGTVPPACPSTEPGCNLPLNAGTVGQIKQGGLTVAATPPSGDIGFLVLNGKVGVGTPSPSKKLDVDNGDILVQGAGSFMKEGDIAALYLGDTNHFIEGIFGKGVKIGTYRQSDAFFVQQVTGNIGIGTAAPSKKLEIVSNDDFAQIIRFKRSDDTNFAGIGASAYGKALTFHTKDIERMRISDTGKVGIGTQVPGSKLVVKGSGGTSATSGLHVTDSNGNSLFFVRDDGNVGIGTTNPASKLHIISDTKLTHSPVLALESSTGDTPLDLINNSLPGGVKTLWRLEAVGNVSGGIKGISTALARAGNLDIGFDSTPFNDDGVDFVALSIKSLPPARQGFVGIGTVDPVEKLHVLGKVRADDFCLTSDTSKCLSGSSGSAASGSSAIQYYFMIAESGTLYYRVGEDGRWNAAGSAELMSPVGVSSTVDKDKNIVVSAKGGNGKVYRRIFYPDSQTFSPWKQLGNEATQGVPSVVTR